MILRKPYAFFIKMFKPMNFGLSILVAYLIYLENKILSYFNLYIYSAKNTATDNIREKLFSSNLIVLPVIIIIFSILILIVMYRKKKPSLFYVINIIAFIVIIILNVYVGNFLGIMEETTVAIRSVKLTHDLILINMILESLSFVVLIVRGMGINFKKFDFDSEIAKFNINESDKEEFEVSINLDLNESRTNRRRKWRYFVYKYGENKILFNIIIATLLLVLFIVIYFLTRPPKYNVEGTIYSTSSFNFVVDGTSLLDTDYQGNKITDNTLVVVNARLNSFLSSKSLYLKDFSLKIDGMVFRPTNKYSKFLLDFGNAYDESILTKDYNNYLFIYEIPKKYDTSTMFFRYNDEGIITQIKLNPKPITNGDFSLEKSIGEEMSLEESLGNIRFKINDYDIKNKYTIKYKYCIKENDCIDSIEYLKPSLNTNFDKYILRLNVDYTNNSNLDVDTFYKLFSKFGAISYKINNTWYLQSVYFEEIKSNKSDTENDVYIGINSIIDKSSDIKLVFNIRGYLYEYVLK